MHAIQDTAMAEQHGGACAAVATAVTLPAAPVACGLVGLLHDVPAHHLQMAPLGVVAHADLQTQQVRIPVYAISNIII